MERTISNNNESLGAPETKTTAVRLQPWALALVGAVLFAAAGHLLIKFGLTTSAGPTHTYAQRLMNPWLLMGLSIYGLGTVMWVFAVSRRTISYLYPITAMNYAVVAIGGKLLFGESISTGRWLGIVTVIIGVALMQWSAKSENA